MIRTFSSIWSPTIQFGPTRPFGSSESCPPRDADRQSRVYAELSAGYHRVDEVDAALDAAGVELVEIPRAALFLAGKAFQSYRVRGGTRTGVLPDFFIGAHAAVEGLSLLTRNIRRYRSYFPTITLITPGDT